MRPHLAHDGRARGEGDSGKQRNKRWEQINGVTVRTGTARDGGVVVVGRRREGGTRTRNKPAARVTLPSESGADGNNKGLGFRGDRGQRFCRRTLALGFPAKNDRPGLAAMPGNPPAVAAHHPRLTSSWTRGVPIDVFQHWLAACGRHAVVGIPSDWLRAFWRIPAAFWRPFNPARNRAPLLWYFDGSAPPRFFIKVGAAGRSGASDSQIRPGMVSV